jgi:hypothetical protein
MTPREVLCTLIDALAMAILLGLILFVPGCAQDNGCVPAGIGAIERAIWVGSVGFAVLLFFAGLGAAAIDAYLGRHRGRCEGGRRSEDGSWGAE